MRLLFSILAIAILPAMAAADTNFGVRAGMTFGPDQFHVGGHMDTGPFFTNYALRPNLEIGFGDDLVVAAANIEAVYRFADQWQTWSPYLGGGIGVNRVDPDDARLRGDASTEAGPLIVGGLERGLSAGGRLFLESKVGLGNVPDLKLTVGWTFGN